jgi:hypothetical protein
MLSQSWLPRWPHLRQRPQPSRPKQPGSQLHVEGLEDRCVPSTVTNLNDAGAGSLRDAIATTPAGGTVDFQPGMTGTILLTSGELAITQNVTISGPGASVLTVSGNSASRVFDVTAPVTVAISGLSITGGSAPQGGGVFIAGGSVSLLADNLFSNAAGSTGASGSGAGVFIAGGTVSIVDTEIANNHVTSPWFFAASGGGIYVAAGTVAINSSTLQGNQAAGGPGSSIPPRPGGPGEGGGMFVAGGMVSVQNSTFASNRAIGGQGSTNPIGGAFGGAGEGGGMFVAGGIVSVQNSTFGSNLARGGNGGAGLVGHPGGAGGPGAGGGIDAYGGMVSVQNSTFGSNLANGGLGGTGQPHGANGSAEGGGILTPTNPVTLFDTIIAGNTAGDVTSTVVSRGHNLIGDGTGATGFVASDLVGTTQNRIDPKLGPLASNGGPTQTMALLPGSPAIGAGDPTNAPMWDQRGPGFPRVINGTIDIGAFELQRALFQVTSTADSGPGSLRQALLDSDALTGLNTIHFAIGSGVQTIRLDSPLPTITTWVILDGTTQPGYAGTPMIVLTGGGSGLTTTAGYSTVRGLVINSSDGLGIDLEGQGHNLIVGNYIGTDVSGTQALGNDYGVVVGSSGNTIGGTDPGAGNLIAGNRYDGIYLEDTGQHNVVLGNFIGTDVSGTLPLPNKYGVLISGSANTIGGTDRGARNLISGNSAEGVALFGDHNQVLGNDIGTDVTGKLPLGNGDDGIFAQDFGHGYDNTIGGSTARARNKIAFNGNDGIFVQAITGTAILRNAIFANGNLGIELTDGGNNDQAAPVLTAATTGSQQTTISGSLTSTPNTTFVLRFFSNSARDPGEGHHYLGTATVTTDDNGTASFTLTVPIQLGLHRFITATATDPGGNTSAFSAPVQVSAGGAAGPGRQGTWSALTNSVTPVLLGVSARPVLAGPSAEAIGSNAPQRTTGIVLTPQTLDQLFAAHPPQDPGTARLVRAEPAPADLLAAEDSLAAVLASW